MNNKILVANFHCDNCGKDFDVVGTNAEEESEGVYHCIHCGSKGKKVYSFDDFYVERVN